MGLYWHTLRHLKPVQIFGRVRFNLARPHVSRKQVPQRRKCAGIWQQPAHRPPSMNGPEEFEFLGQNGILQEIGWEGNEREKLWRYNQHYFDDLNAFDAPKRLDWHRDLLQKWVNQVPAFEGTGWEPYPTSLRIVNWIKWELAGNRLSQSCCHSLGLQTRWLSKRLEYHLLGNHLFSNAKALIFAGLFFQGDEANRWLAEGFEILNEQIDQQILPDGGHVERSTMYHLLALEDMLDLINLARYYSEKLPTDYKNAIETWSIQAQKMLQWLQVMSHPDGNISFFNDAAFGIGPDVSEIERYGSSLGIIASDESDEFYWLQSSGYARLVVPNAVALLDMAPLGPDHLMGHGHADTLGFEFSLFDQRLLVNGGTSCYGHSLERVRQRGTAAHNCVVIDEANSSQVWSGFRVARRAKPINATIDSGKYICAKCSHDGYLRLPGNPIHERTWQLLDGFFTIKDIVTGTHQDAKAHFHFHPNIKIEKLKNPIEGQGTIEGNNCFGWKITKGHAQLENTTWHPRFGQDVANQTLVLTLDKGHSQIQFFWS